MTEGAGFAVAHQQMFGIFIFAKLAEWMKKRDEKKIDRSSKTRKSKISNYQDSCRYLMRIWLLLHCSCYFSWDHSACTQAKDYLIQAQFMKRGGRVSLFYIMTTSLNFAVYLAILQLGVGTFVDELTQSFQGISNTILPGAVPGIDVSRYFWLWFAKCGND